jgi:drug/metabolite transporter (DMT)-like permease
MRIGVIAPVTAVVGTATPVAFGVIIGERPSMLAWVGVGIAVTAIVLIAWPTGRLHDQGTGGLPAVAVACTAGLAFGLFGIFISRTGDTSGLWPLVSARVASVGIVATAATVVRKPLIPADGRRLAVGAGLLDMAANVLFLLAVRRALLSLVVVIMSMYPAATIGLARIVLKEQFGTAQIIGLGLGVVGIGMIVLG